MSEFPVEILRRRTRFDRRQASNSGKKLLIEHGMLRWARWVSDCAELLVAINSVRVKYGYNQK